ncbi:hypothetical protein [Deinococcus sp. UYEF24]
MNRSLPVVAAFAFATLLSSHSGAQAAATCFTHPTYSFNGRVRIEYPSGRGTASLFQFCDPSAARLRQNVLQQSRAAGLDVRWVEYYRAKDWVSAFHDSIYRTRSMGFQQVSYKQFTVQNWRDTETLVYANSAGKYVGMISRTVPGTTNTSEFVLYGN